MHPRSLILLTCLIHCSVLCVDNTTNVTTSDTDGDFDNISRNVRVQIQVEEPILVNDVVRMFSDSDYRCTDFYRLCNTSVKEFDPLHLECSCDPDCDLFGNCCWDAPVTSFPRAREASCFVVSVNRVGVYMVDRCPENVNSEKIRSLCEAGNTSHDPFAWLPVSGPKKTYRNVYCAVCHDVTDLISWSFDIDPCFEKSFKNCSVALKIPENVTVAMCDTEAISTCPDDKGPDSENCDLYYAPVKETDVDVKDVDAPLTYKNKFCAFCRGIINIECIQPPYTSSVNPLITRGSSYSIIFDIDFWHGNKFVGTVENCHSEPEIPICREITCNKNKCLLDVLDAKSLASLSCTTWIMDNVSYVLDQDSKLQLFNESAIANNTVCTSEFTFGRDEEILTIVCISISIACLAIKIVFYVFVEEKSNKISRKTIIMICASVLIAQLLFVIASKNTDWGVFCIIIGLLLHYFFLASFFWTNVLAYDIWRTFSTMANTEAFHPSRRFLHYNIYCWSCPFLIVCLAMIFQWGIAFEPLQPGYGLNFCWISKKLPLLVLFVSPLAIILCVNLFLFLWTAFRISSAVRASRAAREAVGPDNVRFVLYFKLAFIMGLTWIFGFASAFVDSNIMWCLFVVFNGLQGAFLLLAFTRFRLKAYFMRLRMFVRKATQATGSRTTKSSQEYSTSKM